MVLHKLLIPEEEFRRNRVASRPGDRRCRGRTGPFLVTVDRIVGGVEIEGDVRRRFGVSLQERIDERLLDCLGVVSDLAATVRARRHMLLAVQPGLAGQRVAIGRAGPPAGSGPGQASDRSAVRRDRSGPHSRALGGRPGPCSAAAGRAGAGPAAPRRITAAPASSRRRTP